MGRGLLGIGRGLLGMDRSLLGMIWVWVERGL